MKNVDTQEEQDWIKTTNDEGRLYYFNKSPGQSSWNKPVESPNGNAIVSGQDFPKGVPAPPPKPKTMSKPPPRPVQSIGITKSLPADSRQEPAMKVGTVKELMFSEEQAGMRDPLKSTDCEKVDPDTGFGEWGSVEIDVGEHEESKPVSKIDLLSSMKEEARFTEYHSSQPQISRLDKPVEFKQSVPSKKKVRRISDD